MIKTIASFAIGIAVGAAYASHSPTEKTAGVAVVPTTSSAPFSEMHASIPHPASVEAPAPTF